MIEIKPIEKNEDKIWNSIVKEHPNGTIFHTLEWMNILKQFYKVKTLHLGIYQDNKLSGVFPFCIQRKGIFNIYMSPLHEAATPYGGPIVKADIIDEVIELFSSFSRKSSYFDITLTPNMNLTGNILDKYHPDTKYTYILPLDHDIEKLWGNLNKKCRNMVRKAQKNNICVVDEKEPESLKIFSDMTTKTFERNNSSTSLSEKFNRTVFEALHDTGNIKLLFAKQADQIMAGAIFLTFADRVYYWQGASYPKYNHYAPNNLIQWNLIEWAANNGYKQYDLLGADIPGIAKFKRSFGGKKVGYEYIYRANSPFAKFGRDAYIWWRKHVKKDLI